MSVNMLGVILSGVETKVDRVNTNSSYYRWRIPNFPKIKKTACLAIMSPCMNAKNSRIDWRLQLYPNGKSNNTNDYITVSVEYFTEIDNVVATFELSIENNDKEVIEDCKVKKEINLMLDQSGLSYAFAARRVTFAGDYALQVRRSDLENPKNRMLAHNCLTISFDVTYKDPMVVPPFLRENERIKELNNYGKLLENDEFSDVTFVVGNKEIRAHKAILALRSHVFHAMFTINMREKKQNIVEIVDTDYAILMELFRFMYTGTVRDIEKMACDLLIAAEKYSVERLKTLCEMTLLNNLKIENVVACLAAADSCNAKELKEQAFEFIVNNLNKIIDRDEFTTLSSTLMRDIMRTVIPKKRKN